MRNNLTALVTGSSRGIGREIAYQLAKTGYTIIVHGSKKSPELHSSFARIKKISPQSRLVVADLGNAKAIAELFTKITTLNVLVNNAATQNYSAFIDLKESDLNRIFDVNLRAPFICAQRAARLMKKNKKGGKIINISSVHARDPKRNFAHYSTAKGGLETLTRAMALELAVDNIQVNSIMAGAIATEMTTAERQAILLPSIPANRIGEPREIAQLVLFLCSQKCNYLTGASITVDGGLTLGFCASRPDL